MKLRLRAVGHGRSMEEEAREILKAGLRAKRLPRRNFAQSMRRHVDPLGGVELVLPPRLACSAGTASVFATTIAQAEVL